MHKYWGFGLCILSEIEFPELLPADFTDADITITTGTVPADLEGENVIRKPFSIIGSNEYLLNVKNICRYCAGLGNTIIAAPQPGADLLSVRLFLLGTVMAAILYQRGSIPLHASAIVKDGRLVLFAGNSGAGKSTLLALLATKGYEVFTDDICVLKTDAAADKALYGTASYPMIKLWEDALSKIDSTAYNKDFKVRPQLPKFGQFFYDSFNMQSLPVAAIFILSPTQTASDIQIDKMDPVQAFKKLEKQSYKHTLIAHTQLRALQFSILSQLASHVPVYEVARPLQGTNVAELSATVEKMF